MLKNDRRTLTYCGRKMVLTLGSTFGFELRRLCGRCGLKTVYRVVLRFPCEPSMASNRRA